MVIIIIIINYYYYFYYYYFYLDVIKNLKKLNIFNYESINFVKPTFWYNIYNNNNNNKNSNYYLFEAIVIRL